MEHYSAAKSEVFELQGRHEGVRRNPRLVAGENGGMRRSQNEGRGSTEIVACSGRSCRLK